MVLEVAVNGGADWLLTFNLRDFANAAAVGCRDRMPGTRLADMETRFEPDELRPAAPGFAESGSGTAG